MEHDEKPVEAPVEEPAHEPVKVPADAPSEEFTEAPEALDDKKPKEHKYTLGEIAQIVFELAYMIFLLTIIGCVLFSHLIPNIPSAAKPDELIKWSLTGGFIGGWLIDMKWLYTVTAHGRNNQKAFVWESKKIIWRLVYPFSASIFSFSMYMLGRSGVLFFYSINSDSYEVAFSLSFMIGCFSDDILSTVFKWIRDLFGLQNKYKFEEKKDHTDDKK